MRNFTFDRIFAVVVFMVTVCTGLKAQTNGRDTVTVFDAVRFYDGYLVENNPEDPTLDGILRHRTSLYAIKLTDEQLAQIGDSLEMHVRVQACCDNYDRIGNVNIAFVPKGQETYKPDEVQRIEIGRFITPFMNKNKKPDTVPYEYKVPYLSYIFRDSELRAQYDIWVELEIFGVPYAANQQIKGCADRSDVFLGTLKFSTINENRGVMTDKDVLVPIVIKNPEYIAHNLNNYDEQATDELGKTIKTYTFTVPKDVADGQLVLVTSNHGANEGGEEYNRRWHYIYYDGGEEPVMVYKPGRNSCEPFRKYNTCPNGIYGYFKRTDETWQSFSNWCPGDVIDNRIIDLGEVKAGTHTVCISVPDAEFVGKQGDIPVSIFFQGLTEGILNNIEGVSVEESKPLVTITKTGKTLVAGSSEGIVSIELRDLQGKLVRQTECGKTINCSGCASGIYLVSVELMNGIIETHKVLLDE
ncbi:peptide-N-glycosidase F-related protein [uncultured Prevotella sp.]|uniref:peptide-N-glycosidase F-related protein n=1 Tax=uncultured Prevotella sp. TaxID=159272 RepID=UPI002617E734|nr:peptide-N-glycosidase F-related protein [uncultured Prevotella sp.]